MSEERREMLLDLLTKQALYGLSDNERAEMERLRNELGDDSGDSFDLAAAAVGLIDIDASEPMPKNLRSRVAADAERYFDAKEEKARASRETPRQAVPARSLRDWLGWAVAAAACLALVINIWLTRVQPRPDIAKTSPTPTASTPPSLAEQRERLLKTPSGVITAAWSPGTYAAAKNVSGDVVWSESEKAGFMRLSGLPVNDKSTQTYQLWIFDESQDEKTPIDGGTFDVDSNGEMIVPITAKLQPVHPKMFAITLEKAGGVVVSKRDKLVALGKLQS
jgi:anti-sigma-K factor RskA